MWIFVNGYTVYEDCHFLKKGHACLIHELYLRPGFMRINMLRI